MKHFLMITLFLMICNSIFSQDKPVKVPGFIIHNKFTNRDSFVLIRWVTWTEEQKLKIFTFAQEQSKSFEQKQMEVSLKIQNMRDELKTEEEKNQFDEKKKASELLGNAQSELATKVQNFIESLMTEDQKKEFTNKKKNAALMKEELDKNLKDFDEKTKQLKASPFNENLYHVLTSATKYIQTPEIWALTRTPLTDEEKNLITDLLNKLMQVEQGFHLAVEKTSEEMNISNGYSLFDFNMKKDFGTDSLYKEMAKFSKSNQEIFTSLVSHYVNQKKALLAIYQKYGEKTKFEIPMSAPKIIDEPIK